MTPEALLIELRLHGLSCRVARDEVQIETCTNCGNSRWNLELNAPAGVFKCWACNWSGRLDGFLTRLTGSPHEIPVREIVGGKRAPALVAAPFRQVSAADHEGVSAYLLRRGIPPHVSRAYSLGVCVEKGHLLEDRITVPLQDLFTGEVLGHQGRSWSAYPGLREARPKYLSTLTEKVVVGWSNRDAPVVLVEGPFDGIAVHRAGFSAAVLSGTSTAGIDWFVSRLPPGPLLILLDGDAAEAARRLTARVSAVRKVRSIPLPAGHDPADFTPEALRQLLRFHASSEKVAQNS